MENEYHNYEEIEDEQIKKSNKRIGLKVFIGILLSLFLLGIVSFTSFNMFSSIGSLVFEKNDTGYTISGGANYAPENGILNIPEEYNGEFVTRIKAQGFRDNSNIFEVNIPGCVEVVEEEAFVLCSNLKKVNIETGVRVVEEQAFGYSRVEELYVSGTLEAMGERCFSGYDNLKILTIPFIPLDHYIFGLDNKLPTSIESLTLNGWNGTTSIPDEACKDYKNLKYLKLGNNVRSIGTSAFSGCSNLKEVILSDKLQQIQSLAFAQTAITKLTLPANLVKYDGTVTLLCENLQDIVVKPESVYYKEKDNLLCTNDFKNLAVFLVPNVTTYNIPQYIESISPYCFAQYPFNLTSINFNNVKRINEYGVAFQQNLEEVYLSKSIESIGSCAFIECPKLKRIIYEGSNIQWGMDVYKEFNAIPEGVEIIFEGGNY